MARRFAVEYIDGLMAGDSELGLAMLSSAICSTASYSPTAVDYQLPRPAFVFVEMLTWVAQSVRSGVWTCYEATPLARQEQMQAALRATAADSLAAWYEQGMRDWQDEDKIAAVDNWIMNHEDALDEWLLAHAKLHRDVILTLT